MRSYLSPSSRISSISCNKKFRKNNNNIKTSLGQVRKGSIVWKIQPCIIYSIMQRATFISRHCSVSLAGRCCGLPRRGGNRRAENGFADSNLMRFHSQLTGPYTRLTWINGANDYPATLCAIPGRIYLSAELISARLQTRPHIAPNEFLSASYLREIENCRNWISSFFTENYSKES